MYDFYDKLQQVYVDNNIYISAFVFKCDENRFQTDPSKLKAIGQKCIAPSRISGGFEIQFLCRLSVLQMEDIYHLLLYLKEKQYRLDGMLSRNFICSFK